MDVCGKSVPVRSSSNRKLHNRRSIIIIITSRIIEGRRTYTVGPLAVVATGIVGSSSFKATASSNVVKSSKRRSSSSSSIITITTSNCRSVWSKKASAAVIVVIRRHYCTDIAEPSLFESNSEFWICSMIYQNTIMMMNLKH